MLALDSQISISSCKLKRFRNSYANELDIYKHRCAGLHRSPFSSYQSQILTFIPIQTFFSSFYSQALASQNWVNNFVMEQLWIIEK